MLIPFATDKETLSDEKLPGPIFIKINVSRSIMKLFSLRKISNFETSKSFLFSFLPSFFDISLLLNFKAKKSSLPMMFIKRIFFILFSFFYILIPLNILADNTENIEDYGLISLMYHRFDENKYPSTNIRMNEFIEHINLIEQNEIKFINPKNFENEVINNKNQRKILLTIDDGFSSFYNNAWPVLKSKKIPFILFVSTREVGKSGYMNWSQINELHKYEFVEIGNHSHTHDYLVDFNIEEIEKDIKESISLFKKNLNYNSKFFSYPFGEYSLAFKNLILNLGFDYAFGQHSGVIDETKDFIEMPRFPINEKYGEIKRFKTLLKTIPLKYKKILPMEKYINDKTNPPKVEIEFYDFYNLKNLNCFSNEENEWRNSIVNFKNKNTIEINLEGKFTTERGRINCSLRENNGYYRWLGLQFVIAEK